MVPKIRIINSNSSFKTKSLGELCLVNPTAKLPDTFFYVDLESVVGTELLSTRIEHKGTAPSRAQRVAKIGDVFYQTVRPYQKNNYLFDGKGIVKGNVVFSTGYAQLRPKINSSYLFCLLQSNNFVNEVIKNCTGSSYPAINPTILSLIKVTYSDDETEQRAIADYFTSLDSMISSTANKIAKLEQTKKACLQSMFPQEGERVPKVRFKGFEGEWEVVKLDDCLAISTERNSGNIYGKDEVLSVSDDFGVVNQISLLGRSYAGKSVENYKVLRTNQIVYTKSPLKSKPYGIVKVNKGETGIVSVLYAVYDAKEGVCPDYIHFYFQSKHRVNNYLLPLINKGAKNTMNISDETALEGLISIPSQKEQKMIADYLWSLEKMISLQSRRLSLLKHIKSACLDNMFV
jgi:type I restriction enzyme S subunit